MTAAHPTETVASILTRHRGSTTGFDYLRIGLAVAVVCWHAILTTQGGDRDIWAGLWRPLPAVILPMFFCLSGFLVAGSLFRTATLGEFLLLRVIRLVPALLVEVILCALILGPLLTTLPLAEYFSASQFHSYFLNILGIVHLELPGLFPGNPFPDVVNINLRTLPSELQCYILLAGLALLRLTPRAIAMAVIAVGLMLLATWQIMPQGAVMQNVPPTGKSLILAFLFGVVFFLNQQRIPHSLPLFVVALTLMVLLLLRADTQYLALPFLAYVTVYLGLLMPARKTFLLRGDYSYGLYLFGFPMQQMYAMLFLPNLHWFGSIVFGLGLGLAYAAFSWHFVEKPVLQRKKQIISGYDTLRTSLIATFRRSSPAASKEVEPS